MDKPIRFAALVRVSTEQQEKTGESLRTQRKQVEKDVALMGGVIVGWYGGQEHATPGWEKKEVNRLITDARNGQFDAVIVSNADRWSRDNDKSREGLDVFKANRIKFFVGVSEYDLFNPEHVLFLGMSAVIGQFQASNQKKKSVLNRINRAERGLPTCGKLPFGRTFDRRTNTWGINEAQRDMLLDVAQRYLKGESLPKLAKEKGVNHANLCKLLRERGGDRWLQEFDVPDLNIKKTISIPIPRLLPEPLIQDVLAKLKANRTYHHKPPPSLVVNEYLLSGHLFCGVCGYCMAGQTNRKTTRYYRHCHTDRVRRCPIQDPAPWIRADLIEGVVLRDLFDMLGNPAAIERAVKAAIPDCEGLIVKRTNLQDELNRIGKARSRILSLVEKDAITEDQAEQKLRELKDREQALATELDRVSSTLANIPDGSMVKVWVEQVGQTIMLLDDEGNEYAGGNDVGSFISMDKIDRKKLIETAFAGNLPDGKPAGVYITPIGTRGYRSKKYTYQIIGRMLPGSMPRACCCIAQVPQLHRSCGRPPRPGA